MKRMIVSIVLTLGLLLLLADFAVTARPNMAASSAPAPEFIICQPVGGQPADILYYLLRDQPTPFDVRNAYIDTGTTAGIIFDDGTGPWRRVVHEFRSPIVRTVCQADRAQFEALLGIVTGPQIQGELFEVRHTGTGGRAGTVFIDRGTAGVLATGGGLSVQQTYSCTNDGQPELVLQNVGLFHSGFDTQAIDGASRGVIEREYLDLAQTRLANRARAHILRQGCMEISYDNFATLVQGGMPSKLHYDQGDPSPAVYRQQ